MNLKETPAPPMTVHICQQCCQEHTPCCIGCPCRLEEFAWSPELPCGGISVNGAEPKCCEVHMLPWGHRRR